MRRSVHFLIGLAGVFLVAGAAARADEKPTMSVTYGEQGVSSIKFAGAEFAAENHPALQHLRLSQSADGTGKDRGAEAAEFSPTESTFDAAKKLAVQNFTWGRIECTFAEQADRLNMTVEVANTSSSAISVVYFSPLRLKLAFQPEGTDWANHYPIVRYRPDQIPALVGLSPTGRIALCGSDEKDAPAPEFGLTFEGDDCVVSVRFESKPLLPGEKRKSEVSLRLAGAGGDDPYDFVRDVLTRYATGHPFKAKWDDHRPIATAFLAHSEDHPAANPRGWFGKHVEDTTSPEGVKKFHAMLDDYVSAVIANSKKLNAQGVLVWDVEGQQMPHPISYLGDPRVLAKEAPEMDSVADAMFKRFTDAGLRTGLTIRPDRVVPAADGWAHESVTDVVGELSDKIEYAHRRWGCTMFYIDSNIVVRHRTDGQTDYPPMPVDLFEKLAAKHPDMLLIPEQETAAYWAVSAPYNELRQEYSSTPAIVRATYPKSFSVLRVVDGPPLEEQWAALKAAVKAGDILLFRAWFDDPVNDQVKKIYEEAGQ